MHEGARLLCVFSLWSYDSGSVYFLLSPYILLLFGLLRPEVFSGFAS